MKIKEKVEVKFLIDQDGAFGEASVDEVKTLDKKTADVLESRGIVEIVTKKKGVKNGSK